jgi:transposase
MSHEVKYIGMDVHKEAIVIAVLNGSGKLVMETILETKASGILQFLHGLRGELRVTWEEGTWAAWLYDLLQPQVQEVVVCNPRRNALLKEGSKSDKVDARKLAELLRSGMLRPVYHGENGLRTLRELGRSYQTIGKDLTRVMNRLKAVYRGWGIPCAGIRVYAARYREEWLSKLPQAGVRRRAELLYQQLDGLQALRREVRPEFLAETRKHKAAKLLRQIPCIGPIRAARLIALMQTPHRFRSKRQLWTYSGLGIETHDSAQYRYVGGLTHTGPHLQDRSHYFDTLDRSAGNSLVDFRVCCARCFLPRRLFQKVKIATFVGLQHVELVQYAITARKSRLRCCPRGLPPR